LVQNIRTGWSRISGEFSPEYQERLVQNIRRGLIQNNSSGLDPPQTFPYCETHLSPGTVGSWFDLHWRCCQTMKAASWTAVPAEHLK
jgi:hypothetical protein